VRVQQLLEWILSGDSAVTRDDAAEEIARTHWEKQEAQEALVLALANPDLDSSLKQTCAEALADIWFKRGEVNGEVYRQLSAEHQEFIDLYLKD
jgi:uncharacterized protein YjiS (DUF1127 family)